MIIVGLVILIAAVIVAVAGVLANSGSGHALPHDFAVLGYHVTGSTGTLFLYGIVVGARPRCWGSACCWPGRAGRPAAAATRGAGSGSPGGRPPPSARTATT